MSSIPILYRSSHTAATDAAFKVVPSDTWFESIDIFIYDNNAYMGDIRDQDVLIQANDIYYLLHPVNLNNFFFKNAGAAANIRVVVVGVLLTDIRKRQLGIPVG